MNRQRQLVELIARLTKDGEETPDHPEGYDMPSDDAVDTLADLITQARGILAQPQAVTTLLQFYETVREILQDEAGEWRELNSCADAVQEISRALEVVQIAYVRTQRTSTGGT